MSMLVYKFLWPSGFSAHMTTDQYESACKVALRQNLPTVLTVHPGCDDSVMINANGMWIGVETDGYAHT
jgi:hypothetical protein